jgi:hypothetical protein
MERKETVWIKYRMFRIMVTAIFEVKGDDTEGRVTEVALLFIHFSRNIK